MRLFVGIEFDGVTKSEIARVCNELKPCASKAGGSARTTSISR